MTAPLLEATAAAAGASGYGGADADGLPEGDGAAGDAVLQRSVAYHAQLAARLALIPRGSSQV